METIHIVAAANDLYVRHMAVMLTSLLANKTSGNPVQIHVIDGGSISAENKEKLVKSVGKFHQEIRFIPFNNELLQGVKITERFGREAYYRVFIPSLLPESVHKAIYLDSDLIVLKDIVKLWGISLDQHYIAAVEDSVGSNRGRVLRIPADHYFNSGVLVLDLNKWRTYQVTNRVMGYVKRYPRRIQIADQDGLNAVLHDRWKRLNPEWNCFASLYSPLRPPAIIHYITTNKPWNSHPPGKHEYDKYSLATAW
ncbi:glycosyltransferase family 8 protein [Paenibacillus oceani]|uniref:Glycosyltransferase family 8 protein n=1 Tax=Paenibacillus oceani TaxID=2772510 RepID=A0A927GYX0_9BACL|nr:glycosyltransferase family 8 protein [Paenibacillus oceani]MBD2860884.1 glycosyltransferase family 8 protein [Paenibacillus oceani]